MDTSRVEQILSITFTDKKLLEQAFTHRSYINESNDNLSSNERLEFLGDAVLSFLVSQSLYKEFPHQPEGVLTHFRASLVKTSFLAEVAQKLQFGEFLLLSKGERQAEGFKRTTILGDTVEAFLGALFLDQGLSSCDKFIKEHILPSISLIIQNHTYRDPKSSLQEFTQERGEGIPTYKVLKTEGPDHDRKFTVAVFILRKKMGVGIGKSKHDAEKAAASICLAKLKKL